ncbi:MAG: cytidylate kinase-like family protein [Muribaculaceae bacterium]|nr:cytidylate kinase-like family protein [Muribaculaceae bacterium]
MNYVVTIGRQFGSGGRVIGKLVAEALGIDYYDKELMIEAAKSHGVDAQLFENADEKAPSFFSGLSSIGLGLGLGGGAFFPGHAGSGYDSIYQMQSEVIENLASRGSCVIVGRTADFILRHHENVISIFIHASMDDCVKRIMERHETETVDHARSLAEKRNKIRAAYYNFYTDKEWGNAASYDLCINSSKMSVEEVAAVITNYVKARLGL